MKSIIIPETDNRGTGKIKFILSDDEKLSFEILNKKKDILGYGLEFRIHEGNLIKREVREAQQNLIRSLCKAHPKDVENAKLLYQKGEVLEDDIYKNCFNFCMYISKPFDDAILSSEEHIVKLDEKVLPLCFSILKEAFKNGILTSFIPS